MTNKPISISRDSTIKECAKLMKDNRVGSILILEKNKLKGIITEQDMIYKVILKTMDPKKTKVSEIMTTDMVTISPEKDIYEALEVMRDNELRRLPVVDNNDELVGFLTLKDILKIEPDLFELIAENMQLKEEHLKPLYDKVENGLCEICGTVSDNLVRKKNTIVCPDCINKI
ncbi:CBS domain-containing protein [Candidatus Woesearchaeota archaeon]|nr:CBS domain-containing protein [Candidatus Woesearchaeota archaeon]